jgi:DNA-binding Lrp family transcriptional regulator
MTIDAIDRRIIAATSGGLPLVSAPFAEVARWLGLEEDEVIARMAAMQDSGVIRRIALAPNHYALGLVANGMSVWDVADAQVDDLGARIGALDFVSHCYRRPRALPDWPTTCSPCCTATAGTRSRPGGPRSRPCWARPAAAMTSCIPRAS